MKTSELTGAALDWAVATCSYDAYDGLAAKIIQHPAYAKYYPKISPSTDWRLGGPIIERERISIRPDVASEMFRAFVIRPPDGLSYRYIGPTPLIAAMRCYVATKLGDEVEIPQELK